MFAMLFGMMLLGAMDATTKTVLLAAAVGGGGFLLYSGLGQVQSRRREAVKLAQIAAEDGLPHVSEIVASYSVGDYQGALGGLRSLYTELTDPKRREAAINVFLTTQLDKHLSDPNKRELLLTAIEKKLNVTIPRPQDAAPAKAKA